MSKIFEEVKGNVGIRQTAEHFRLHINQAGFVVSPFSDERTPSCKLYFDTNSFYDFSANKGGDVVKFTAAILHTDNWQAAKYLCKVFSLSITLSGTIDRREEIERRQRERQQQEERKQEFKAALLDEIDGLKRLADIYRIAIEKQLYEPFGDLWIYCTNELQKAEYKLNILCGADQEIYRRMKPKPELWLSSDRPQWLLDTLEILAEDGVFEATESELAEIQAQRDFELNRQSRKDRTCGISW